MRLQHDRRGASYRYPSLSLYAADGVDSVFLTFGIGSPELREFGLIHIGQFLPQIFERVEKLLAVSGLIESLAQGIDNRCWRSFRRKYADPEIIFEVVAQFLEG